MLNIVLFYICATFFTVTPHPLLQRYQRQCQCPVNNFQQNPHVNVAAELPRQNNMAVTPQLVNQAYNTFVQNPHQCIPVRDQENQQFLNSILENPLIKALRGQNNQHFQNPAQNPPHPHVVNNYFIIPTEALLSEEDEKAKKSKSIHSKKEGKNNKAIDNNEPNDSKVHKTSDDKLQDETHVFLDEYFNREPHSLTNGRVIQNNATPHKCLGNEQRLEVELQPTVAKIQEHHRPEAVNAMPNMEAEEAVIQDVRNKFPNMPEPLLRSLVAVIRQKLQRFHLSQLNRYPQNQRPMARRYGNSTVDETDNHWQRRPGHRRPLRRNLTRKRKGSSNRNATVVGDVERTPKKTEKLDLEKATRVEPPATEFNRNDETTTENFKHVESQNFHSSNEIENTTPYIVYGTHHNVILPELGYEDIVPNVDNGINDDYYPDFRNENKGHAIDDAIFNHPEFYDEVLRSERKVSNAEAYRSKILDGKKVPKKVMRKLSERQSKRNNAERRHDKSEEIMYKTPPGLESPDFKTVNIREYHSRGYERPSYFSHEYAQSKDMENEVRASSDEPIITYYLPRTPADVKRKRAEEKLETVFANSKIVNYGSSFDAYDGDTTTIGNMFSLDLGSDSARDNDTPKTVVESEEFGW